MSARARQRGFSLLEILAAMTLVAMILAMAYTGLSTSIRAVERGEAVVERTNRLRAAQEFLRKQISRTMPLAWHTDERDGTRFVFEGNRDGLRFVAPMPGYLGRGGPYVQTLRVAEGENGLQLEFTHHILNGFDSEAAEEDQAEREAVALLDGIDEARFSFLRVGEDGEELEWVEEWEDPSLTPLIVRIEFAMREDSRAIWPVMDIPLMLDTGAGSRRLLEPQFFPGLDAGGAPVEPEGRE